MNAMALYRLGHWCHLHRIPLVPRLIRIVTLLVYNSVIPVTAQIGEGTTFGARILGPICAAEDRPSAPTRWSWRTSLRAAPWPESRLGSSEATSTSGTTGPERTPIHFLKGAWP